MKISCLIAAYRAGNYIAKALESIQAQAHGDWEVVVVEDGSRDATEAIVEAFARRVRQPVRYENLGENRGVATARTRLMERAQGDAIAFLDADDWWTPRHLSGLHARFDEGADLVVSRIQLFDLDTQRPLETYYPPAGLFTHPAETIFSGSAIMTSSSVGLRRSLIERCGGFDPAFRIGEDRDYWLRAAQLGARFAGVDEATCFYSKHATSTMGKTLLWAEQEVAFYRKHRDFRGVSEKRRHAALAHALTNYGRLRRASDPRASRMALAEAFKLAPSFGVAAHWIRSAVG